MGKIIEFSKDYSSIYYEIIKELKNAESKNYSFSDINNYANRILDKSRGFNPEKCHTLIVKIAKGFGINVYQEKLKSKILGSIKVNGDTKQQYEVTDKVILVNSNINGNVYLQRFILAHILAYYLFNYLGSENQSNNEYFYAEFTHQDFTTDKIANRFAMDILMPKKLFIEQYNIAVKVDNTYCFVLEYLSRYFAVPKEIIARRIKDIQYS